MPTIVAACRTPIGTLLGDLSGIAAPDLGALIMREALSRSGLVSEQIDEVIMGNVLGAGLGQAPARQVAIRGGFGPGVAAVTVNKMCGSGLKDVMMAAQAVRLNDARAIVAGGFESMSRAPHLVTDQRCGWEFGDQKLADSMLTDGLVCAFDGCHVGAQAEHIARTHEVTRRDQDRYACESQRRATEAIKSCAFADEIVPVEVAVRGGTKTIARDQDPPRTWRIWRSSSPHSRRTTRSRPAMLPRSATARRRWS